MANILKVLEGLRSGPDATGPVFSASKHWDYILQSRDYNAHAGTFKNGYLRVGNWKYKAGASDPDGKIMKATMVAMLEKLLADGALHAYQVDEESVHSNDPNGFYLAIVTNGAEGLDKFYASLEDARKTTRPAWRDSDRYWTRRATATPCPRRYHDPQVANHLSCASAPCLFRRGAEAWWV
jgi:hypothetical protein